jgi:hypothetical protein
MARVSLIATRAALAALAICWAQAQGAELIVEEGAVVKLGQDAQLVVRDRIDAREALFTSLKDDSAGGPAGQSAATPAAGDWTGIKLEASAAPGDVALTDVTVRYAGTGLWLRKTSPRVEFLTARECATGVRASDGASPLLHGAALLSNGFGLVSERAAPTLTETQISGNAAYGVFNDTPAIGQVVATGDWWGDASGPTDPIGNAAGTGDPVSEGVNYAAWLAGIPLIDPRLALVTPGASVDTRGVTLALACRNAIAYRLAENGNFGAAPFLPMADTAAFTLSPGDGLKQVEVEYRAGTGNTVKASMPGGILYDTLGPVVSLVSPQAGALVTRPFTLEAAAADPAGVTRVEFYLDDQRVATDTGAPYASTLAIDALADGAHTVKAVAFDALGRAGSDSRGIVVHKPVETGLAIDARATIYGAGQAGLPDPFALPPAFVRFAPGVGKALTVTSTSGQVTSGGISNGADGSSASTDVGALGGLSGIRVNGRHMFLAGVFLTDSAPQEPAPPPLALGNTGFALLAPVIGQVFYIGDGLTGTGSGQRQVFAVPPGATRLFFGFADSSAPGATASGYGDNSGILNAGVAIEDNAIADLTGPTLSGVSYAGLPLAAGQTLTRSASLSVAAVDPSGVSRVDFFLDTVRIGTDGNGTDGYGASVDLVAVSDGAHVLTVKAYDSLNNVTETSVPVTVALAAPAAPSITGPANGLTTAQKRQTVTGSAEPGTQVQLYVNGAPSGSAVIAAGGSFSIDATLAEGANRLQTAASNRGGSSGFGNEVVVTVDTTIPAAPLGLSAAAQAGRRVRLVWQQGGDLAAKGYHVYRASAPFSDLAQAARANTELITALSFDDFPPADGVYYYRAVAVNALDTPSTASGQASAVADGTAPRALGIEYQPSGPYDAAGARLGRGRVGVTLRLSEAASSVPFLSIAPTGGGPIALALAHVTDTEYRGSFDITENTLSGIAYAVFSARDAVGNRGTEIASGASLLIDAAGPDVTALSVAPADPIKNDPGAPVSVTVAFTLSEPVKPGAIPSLSYTLSGTGRSPVAIGGLIATGPTSYRASFPLPADAGAAQIEELSFVYAGADDLDNTSTRILSGNRFQVYQGALPPAAVPTGLDAQPLPGGKVDLTWTAVEQAAAYQLYRQAPGEPALSPYRRVTDTAYVDATSADGVHRYALASIRTLEGEQSLSVRGPTVEVRADSTRPDPPRDLTLALAGAGVLAVWKAPAASDVAGYNVYRASTATITSLDGLAPLKVPPVQGLSFIDPAPVLAERTYVVTAVDAAGNESPVSNSANLDFTLLPVNSLKVVQTEDALPVVSWTHPGGDVAGYDIYVGPDDARIKLNGSPLGVQSFTDTGYTGDERRYTVVAVATGGQQIGRTLTLPRLEVKLVGGLPLRRGVFNRLDYRLANLGDAPIANARLKVAAAARSHLSAPFFLNPGETKIISVVVGGYADLEASAALTATVEITPNEGERVEIARATQADVRDGSLTLAVQSESLTRATTGRVRFTLSNPSEVETQIVTARGLGASPSDQVRVRLVDRDGNVLASQPFYQVSGDVQTYSSGLTLARIAPGASFTSAPIDLPLPSAAPDDIAVLLEIDQVHYRLGEPEQASLPGLAGALSARLQDNAYYARITGIEPQISFGDRNVVIRGRAVDTRSAQPLAKVPVKLILAVNGFERRLDLFTDAGGDFVYTLVPQRSDAGEFVVSAIHPDSFERPDHGRFLISRVGVSPTQITLKALRNIAQPIALTAVAAEGSRATNLRLLLEPADQPAGALPAGVTVSTPAPLTLASGQHQNLVFSVTGDNRSADIGALVLRLVYDERGSDPLALIRIDYRFYDAGSSDPDVNPSLFPTPSYVETSAARDSLVTEQVTLENKGLGVAKDIKVTLVKADGSAAPAWVALANPAELGALEPGARATVDLSIAPDATVAEGIYSFKLRVTGSNIPRGEVNLFVSVTQGGTGNLLFKAADFYTATLDKDGKVVPGLSGATVSIQNERVADQRFVLSTDALGEAYFSNIPAGRYRFRATAPGHQEASGSTLVKPGLTVTQDLFLNNALVSVQWSVRETSIQDRYEIALALTYETNVPAPVVVIEPALTNLPKLSAGDVYYGELTLSNYGLVRAENITPVLPASDAFLRYEFLSDIPRSLAAKQRITIPYRIVALNSLEPDGASTGGGCFEYLARLFLPYDFECANGSRSVGGAESRWSYAAGTTCPVSLLGAFNAAAGAGGGGAGGGFGVGGAGAFGALGGGDFNGRSGFGGGFIDYVPAYESMPGAPCVPGCNGRCCSAGGGTGGDGGVPAGGGAGSAPQHP